MKNIRAFLLAALVGLLVGVLATGPSFAAATWTITERSIFGNKRACWGTVTLDTSYVTGGYQVTAAKLGLASVGMFLLDGAQFNSTGTAYIATYSRPTGYIQIYQSVPGGTVTVASFTPSATASAPVVTVGVPAVTAQIQISQIGALTTAPAYFADNGSGQMGLYSSAAIGRMSQGYAGFYVTAASPTGSATAPVIYGQVVTPTATLSGSNLGFVEVPNGSNLATVKLGWFALGN